MPAPLHVLFIHGMWVGGQQWTAWEALFRARGWTTHAPSLRHHDVDPHGAPPDALGAVSLLDYCRDLEVLIDHLPAPPVLVGHSMGGLLAQRLAARGRACAAVLLAPAPPAGWPATLETLMPRVTVTLAGTVLGPGLSARPHRLSFGRAAHLCLNNLTPERQREEYERWVWESGRVLFEMVFWWLDRARAAHVDPARVTVPTLTVAAGKDRITPRPVVEAVARRYRDRGGEYRLYERLAHLLVCEPGWEQVADDCADWIAAR